MWRTARGITRSTCSTSTTPRTTPGTPTACTEKHCDLFDGYRAPLIVELSLRLGAKFPGARGRGTARVQLKIPVDVGNCRGIILLAQVNCCEQAVNHRLAGSGGFGSLRGD